VRPADPDGTAGSRRKKRPPKAPAHDPSGRAPGRSHNRRPAPGGPAMYLMMHKFTISQSPYIYLYLLKFFSLLFILHKQRKKNNRRTPIPLNPHQNNVACEFPKPVKTLHNPALFLKRIFL
jgi:hypothetical protein